MLFGQIMVFCILVQFEATIARVKIGVFNIFFNLTIKLFCMKTNKLMLDL